MTEGDCWEEVRVGAVEWKDRDENQRVRSDGLAQWGQVAARPTLAAQAWKKARVSARREAGSRKVLEERLGASVLELLLGLPGGFEYPGQWED